MKKNQQNIDLINKIIGGKEDITELKIEGWPEPLILRPLTSKELLDLQMLEKENQKGMLNIEQIINEKDRNKRRKKAEQQLQKMEQEVNYAQMKENQNNVIYRAISYSAGIPEEMVGELKADVVKTIWKEVVKISNLTKKDLDMIVDFREDDSGEDDN